MGPVLDELKLDAARVEGPAHWADQMPSHKDKLTEEHIVALRLYASKASGGSKCSCWHEVDIWGAPEKLWTRRNIFDKLTRSWLLPNVPACLHGESGVRSHNACRRSRLAAPSL